MSETIGGAVVTPECPGVGSPVAFLGCNHLCPVCGALVTGVPGGGDRAVLGYHLDRRKLYAAGDEVQA